METRAARRKRNSTARAVRDMLQQLAEQGGHEWLPMPLSAETAKLSLDEWVEYRQRRARHLERSPDYDAKWGRPDARTAKAVWDLLAAVLDTRLEEFFPRFPHYRQLPPDECNELVVGAKQALLVVLDGLVCAGRQLRTVTLNYVFEALAERWSDHYRRAQEEGRAFQVSDMHRDTVLASRRDLLRNGIRLDVLWRVATGKWSEKNGRNPLYYVRRLPYGGYQVFLRDSPELAEFERLVREDPSHRRTSLLGPRLLLADDPLPPRRLRREICAERAYNEVRLGPRSERLLAIQEEVRLLFDREAFLTDYHRAERKAKKIHGRLLTRFGVDAELTNWKPTPRHGRSFPSPREQQVWRVPADRRPEVKRLLAAYDRARECTASLRVVYEQLQLVGRDRFIPGPHEYLPIKSGFYRTINRRYQPAHLWPPHVSSDLDWVDTTNWPIIIERTSMRGRWFDFPGHIRNYLDMLEPTLGVYGFDISSSQTQILALLLGLEDLERVACLPEKPFKKYLVEHAWRKHWDPNDPFTLKGGYHNAEDSRLVELVKGLWMRVLYGSRVAQVERDQSEDPSTYGPGWTKENAGRFLASLPWYQEVNRFLEACRRLVKVAYEKDPYRGVIFVDPSDGAGVRWNPVRRADVEISSSGQKLIVSLPGKYVGKRYRAAPANAAGDYPVDRRELTNMVAPCLVHMLDAYFSSLVIERLAARGIREVVGIHDCWLVPSIVEPNELAVGFGPAVLQESLRDATEEWFKGLGPVYDRLLYYLGADPQFGLFVQDIKARWEKRAQAKRWPRFAVTEAKLFHFEAGKWRKLAVDS